MIQKNALFDMIDHVIVPRSAIAEEVSMLDFILHVSP